MTVRAGDVGAVDPIAPVTDRTRVTFTEHGLDVLIDALETAMERHGAWEPPTIEEHEAYRDQLVVVREAKQRIAAAQRAARRKVTGT